MQLMCRHFAVLALALFGGCNSLDDKVVTRSFSATGITTVILRGFTAASAKVVSGDATATIDVSGIATGSAVGYHSPDPNWKETPPEKWGFDFVARRDGAVLTISTKGEVDHIHHHYALHGLRILVPSGVEVVREELSRISSAEAVLRPSGSAPPRGQSGSEKRDSADLMSQADALERDGKYWEAVRVLRRAVRAGNGKAAIRLAEIFDKGAPGVSRDNQEALYWAGTARELGETVDLSIKR
jgi:hypothetical protein